MSLLSIWKDLTSLSERMRAFQLVFPGQLVLSSLAILSYHSSFLFSLETYSIPIKTIVAFNFLFFLVDHPFVFLLLFLSSLFPYYIVSALLLPQPGSPGCESFSAPALQTTSFESFSCFIQAHHLWPWLLYQAAQAAIDQGASMPEIYFLTVLEARSPRSGCCMVGFWWGPSP